MEDPETCQNSLRIPSTFKCQAGCCGLSSEEYCCEMGIVQFHQTIFTLSALVLFVMLLAWCCKKCTNASLHSTRTDCPQCNTTTRTHNGCLSYKLCPEPTRQNPPSYEEATGL